MNRRTAILLGLALLASPAAAQDFATELTLDFGYLGGKVDEPLVAISGVASPRYAFREDSSGRNGSVTATRWRGGVPDDGATPLALLPFVSRRSWLTAGVALASRSRDSYGVARADDSALESRLSADASETSGALDAGWFFRRELAVHAAFSADSFRETDAYTTASSPPVGTAQAGQYSPKRSAYTGSLGLLFRPTEDASVELAGMGGTATTRTTQWTTLGPQALPADTRDDAESLGVSISGRLLLARRRVSLEASAAYQATHGDSRVTEPYESPLSSSHAITRSVSGAAAWFPLRTLGVTLGASYLFRGTTSGSVGEGRAAAVRQVVWSGGVRWFPRPRASVALLLSRTTTDSVTPPEGDTFQRLLATDDRVGLEAALRF